MFCLSDRRQVGQIVIDRRICQCVPRGQGMSRIPHWKLDHPVENFCISLLGFTGSNAAYCSDWHKMSQDRDGTEWIRTAHITENIKIYGRVQLVLYI